MKRLIKCQPNFHPTSLIKKSKPRAKRETQATVFTLVKGKIDFQLPLSKQVNLNFNLKFIYCPALQATTNKKCAELNKESPQSPSHFKSTSVIKNIFVFKDKT